MIKYRFVDDCWVFYVSTCIMTCSKRERMIQVKKEMKFVFVQNDGLPEEMKNTPQLVDGTREKKQALVFGVYEKKQKVSHAKRYKVVCDKGGYIELDGNCIFFDHGTFEFLFLVKGPDDEYPKQICINIEHVY